MWREVLGSGYGGCCRRGRANYVIPVTMIHRVMSLALGVMNNGRVRGKGI